MEKWRQLKFDTKLLIAGFILLGLVAILFSGNKAENESSPSEDHKTSVDTFIPRGQILIPLELANAESLNSLLGDMGGVVDLYLASSESRKGGLKIASKVKLVRAPLNPQQYAVLVKDSEGPRILSYPGPLLAVVQNPDERGSQLVEQKQKSIRIDYQN